MKIQKFLSGGTPTFQAITDPFMAPADNSTAAASSKKEDSGLISDDLVKKLYETGIPTDVDDFLEKVGELEHKQSMGIPVSAGMVRKLEALGNRVIQQAKYLKEAEEKATSNEALGEVAVGSRGELFVADADKSIKQVSLSEFNPEKMTALTVGEILEARKFAPSEAWDQVLIPAAKQNVGMPIINKYIQDIVKTVGSATSISEAYTDLAGYVGREAAKKPTQQQYETLQGLANIMNQVGTDAIFKNKEVMEDPNVEAAFKYIASVLPRPMQQQLMGRYVANGGDYKAGSEHIGNIISLALASGTSVKEEHHLDYDASMNKAAGTTAGSKEQNRNLGVLEQLVQGSLGKRDYKLISSKSPTSSMTLHGSGVGSLADFNNNIVDKTPLSVTMKAGLAPLIDQNHVTVGDQKIKPGSFDTILYDGGEVLNIWAPVDGNGDIDLSQLQVFDEVQKIINRNPQLTPEDKNQLLQQHNLDGYYDYQNVFHGGRAMGQFLVMTGLTSDEVIDPDENLYADKLTKEEKNLEMPLIDRIYGQLNKGIKDKDQQYKFIKGWFDWSTDLVKAPVFMRLNNTAQIDVGTFSDKGPLVQTPSYQHQLAYDQMRYSQQKPLNTTSTSVLYDE